VTTLQAQFRNKSSFRQRSLPVVAALCLFLLALLAVAQVAHVHQDQSDADHCQLCIAMHTLAPATVAAAIILMVELGAPILQVDPIVVARQRYSRLFIRPPPVSC